MLWSLNRCGVFPKVALFPTLLLELTPLEEGCLAAQCKMAVESCQPSVGDSPALPAHHTHSRQRCKEPSKSQEPL